MLQFWVGQFRCAYMSYRQMRKKHHFSTKQQSGTLSLPLATGRNWLMAWRHRHTTITYASATLPRFDPRTLRQHFSGRGLWYRGVSVKRLTLGHLAQQGHCFYAHTAQDTAKRWESPKIPTHKSEANELSPCLTDSPISSLLDQCASLILREQQRDW